MVGFGAETELSYEIPHESTVRAPETKQFMDDDALI